MVLAFAVVAPVALGACASLPPSQGPRAAGAASPSAGASCRCRPRLPSAPPSCPSTGPTPAGAPSDRVRIFPGAPPAVASRGRCQGCRRAGGLPSCSWWGSTPPGRASAGAGLARLGVGGVFLQGRVLGTASLRNSLALVQRVARRATTPPPVRSRRRGGRAVQTVRGGTIPPFPAALVQGSWSAARLRTRTATWAVALVASRGRTSTWRPSRTSCRRPSATATRRSAATTASTATTPAPVSGPVGTVVAALRAAGVGADRQALPRAGPCAGEHRHGHRRATDRDDDLQRLLPAAVHRRHESRGRGRHGLVCALPAPRSPAPRDVVARDRHGPAAHEARLERHGRLGRPGQRGGGQGADGGPARRRLRRGRRRPRPDRPGDPGRHHAERHRGAGGVRPGLRGEGRGRRPATCSPPSRHSACCTADPRPVGQSSSGTSQTAPSGGTRSCADAGRPCQGTLLAPRPRPGCRRRSRRRARRRCSAPRASARRAGRPIR